MPTTRVARQKRTGRNGQRSRKGCPECRARRIKCDETQPECAQCVRGGRVCRIIDGLFRPHQIPIPTESASRAERPPNRQSSGPQTPTPHTHPEDALESSVPANTPGDVNTTVDGPRPSTSSRNIISLTSQASPPAILRGSIPIGGLLTQSSQSKRHRDVIGTPSVQSLPTSNQDMSTGPIDLQHIPTVTSHASSRISAIPVSIPEESNQDRAEIGFFLRHFADGGGQWMDICTGQRSYFSQYIVQLASQSPLLRYSACALAAKQIGQMQYHSHITNTTPRSKMTASTLLRPNMDFLWYGAKYYEKAILLMAHQISHYTPTNQSENHLSPDEIYRSPDSEHSHLDDHENMSSAFRILAACILCSYEDLNATMRAWTGHLDGINKLLRPHLSSVNFCCIPQPVRALEVSFWYFALNDMLNSFTISQPCRVDVGDIALWQKMGLQLDSSGRLALDFIEEAHHELIFFKALIRLLCKLVTYNCGNTSQWAHLSMEFDQWYETLPPDYLAPISQTLPPNQNDSGHLLPETWFGSEPCAIAMALYHMARILLLVNQPQERFLATQPHKSDLLGTYNALQRNLSNHAMEILPIAYGMSNTTVQKYMLQPLYVAGRCLSSWNERQIVVERLRQIEDTLGLATEYRVKCLAEEWGVPYESLPPLDQAGDLVDNVL